MTTKATEAEQGCLNPEIGSAYVYAYAAEELPDDRILTPAQRHAFEVHLGQCRHCEEELIFFCELQEQLKGAFEPLALPVSSIENPAGVELIHEYHELPLQTELAASGGEPEEAFFPLTFTFAGGQAVGQFRKRAGQLFFALRHTEFDRETFRCELHYRSATDVERQQVFTPAQDEELHLGSFGAFHTFAEVLKALKQFELCVRRNA